MFRAAAQSDIGTHKKSNQDSCCVEVAQTPYGDVALAVVCDGVGGLSSGEIASASVINWITNWFEGPFADYVMQNPYNDLALSQFVEDEWRRGLDKMNKAIRSYGRESGSQLGTTFTGMLMVNNKYIIGHVGDCRVYRFDADSMDQITRDQTWVARQVELGNIPVEKARSHPKRNVILQSVGTQKDLEPVFYYGEYRTDEVYIICCDGFRNELFDDELHETFAPLASADEAAMREACWSMIETGMSRGEKDNITVLCISASDDPYAPEVIEQSAVTTGPLAEVPESSFDDTAATTYLGEE